MQPCPARGYLWENMQKVSAPASSRPLGRFRGWVFCAWLVVALGAFLGRLQAQSPPTLVNGPTPATQVPLSGRDMSSGTVIVTQQTTDNSGPNSVNVIEDRVQVLTPYNGSVPQGKATGDVLPLSLEQALAMGMRTNLGALRESASVEQAQGQRTVAASTLRPNLNLGVSEVFERENLKTLGVNFPGIPTATKFNYVDARVRLTQSVIDLVRIRNVRGATENVKTQMAAARNSRDLVVLAVGGTYVQLVTTQARVQAAEAQVKTSAAIYKQAADRFDAGLAARIDRNRSLVQLQTEQQRLRSLQGDYEIQKVQLARLIGLPLGQQFTPSVQYPFKRLEDLTMEAALAQAYTQRPDLLAAQSAVRTAESAVGAAHAERLPTLNIDANFGGAGVTPSKHSTSVYTVAGNLAIPIYEGGRIRGEIAEAEAAVRQRKDELADIHGQIDEDVRAAYIQLSSAADQVAVARSNVDLAHETLTQSTDRFIAGVADSVEVVQSEQAVVQADDDYLTAVYEHNLAKVSLARALGDAEKTLPGLLSNGVPRT